LLSDRASTGERTVRCAVGLPVAQLRVRARASYVLTDFGRFYFAEYLTCTSNSNGHNFQSCTSLFPTGTIAVFKGAQRHPSPLIRDSKSHLKRQGPAACDQPTPSQDMWTCDWTCSPQTHTDTPPTGWISLQTISMRPTVFIRQRARTKFVLFQVPRETRVGEKQRLNHQNLQKDRDIQRVHDKSWSNKYATLIIGILTDNITVLKVPGSTRSSFW